jgi:hypothetical protein
MKKGAEGIGTSCAAASPNVGFSATYYKSTPPTGGCDPNPTAPATFTGTLTFGDQRTVCCQ